MRELRLRWLISAEWSAIAIIASLVMDYDSLSAGQLAFLHYEDRFSLPENLVSLRAMSRSFSLISHGQLGRAVAVNPSGLWLYGAVLANALAGLAHVIGPRIVWLRRIREGALWER